MKVKYIWRKGGTYYYRRRIPADIASILNTSNPFKVVCLYTSEVVTASKMVMTQAAADDVEWERLLKSKQASSRAKAEQLLADHGIDPIKPDLQSIEMDVFHDRLQDMIGEEGNRRLYEGEVDDPVELLDEVHGLALMITKGQLPFMASDALAFYLRMKKGTSDFEKTTKIAFNDFIHCCSDLPLTSYRRSDVNKYIQDRRDSGNKTATVRRRLNSLSAGFDIAIRENELGIPNIFEKAVIPREGKDTKERQPFAADEMGALRNALTAERANKDIPCMIGLLMDTGARLAEIVGLALSDVVLDTATPYIHIRPHGWRRLKNDSSVRKVPLVGQSLESARNAVKLAGKGKFLFKRYTSETVTKSTHASAALNQYIRRKGIDKTCHSLRHSLRDRLRAVECPKEIMDRIGGWATEGVGEKYGKGYSIEMLHSWMLKIV